MRVRRNIGIAIMTAGILLVGAALLLFFRNQWENTQAGNAADQVLPQLKEHIEEADTDSDVGEPHAVYGSDEMNETMIDGYSYIGYLVIPALGLDLPVMSEWDYTRLKLSPCRYAGSVNSNDLVICAHNYENHFGGIRNLSAGDAVNFTDMDGVTIHYTVILVEILEPADVEKMTDGGYDLTLFTCTYGGTSRVTVRCKRGDAL